MRCSSANTLRIQRLEFGREKLTKGPDVIRHTCCHCWRALSPSGTQRAVTCARVQWQWLPQTHVWSCDIVESLGIHLRRDTLILQWFQTSKTAAASDGHAVHF